MRLVDLSTRAFSQRLYCHLLLVFEEQGRYPTNLLLEHFNGGLIKKGKTQEEKKKKKKTHNGRTDEEQGSIIENETGDKTHFFPTAFSLQHTTRGFIILDVLQHDEGKCVSFPVYLHHHRPFHSTPTDSGSNHDSFEKQREDLILPLGREKPTTKVSEKGIEEKLQHSILDTASIHTRNKVGKRFAKGAARVHYLPTWNSHELRNPIQQTHFSSQLFFLGHSRSCSTCCQEHHWRSCSEDRIWRGTQTEKQAPLAKKCFDFTSPFSNSPAQITRSF